MREDTNIKGADTESDFWLIIYSVFRPHVNDETVTENGTFRKRRFPVLVWTRIRVDCGQDLKLATASVVWNDA